MRQRSWVWVVAGFLLTVVGATWYINRVNSSHPAPWPMTLGDAGHRAYTAAALPTAKPQVLWTYPLDRLSTTAQSPVVWTDGTIFAINYTKVIAIDKDGKRRWSWDSQTPVHSLALGRRGTLYVHSGTTIYALEQDGSLSWQRTVDIEQEDPAPLIVGQGGVIYTRGKRFVYAISSDGTVNWRFRADNLRGGPVETPSGKILVVVDQDLYALDHHGDTVWHWPVATGASALAVGSQGLIYVKGTLLQVLDDQSNRKGEASTQRFALAPSVGKDFVQDGLARYDATADKLLWGAGTAATRPVATIIDQRGNVLVAEVGQVNSQRATPVLRLLDPNGQELWKVDEALPQGLAAVTGDGRICYTGIARGTDRLYHVALVCLGEK
jgi:outer membrane protein assembly factor BamB